MEAYYLILLQIDQNYKIGKPITSLSDFSLDKLEINEQTFCLMIENLYDAGYIRNIEMIFHGSEEYPVVTSRLSVTFHGHQYLRDNKALTSSEKFISLAKGLVGIIPAIESITNVVSTI